MLWRPEMELIDQLCGKDMPLSTVIGLFDNVEHARKTLVHYSNGGAISFIRNDQQLPQWEAMGMLRSNLDQVAIADVQVSLTQDAANAFEQGNWASFV